MSVARPWLLWGAVLAAVTIALLAVRTHIDAVYIAMAYLLVVQGSSAHHGRRLGLVMSVLAFVAFDVFFVPPYGTLAVARPGEWIVLAAFLVTSIVGAQLFERSRRVAETARLRAEEITRLSAISEHTEALREAGRLKDALLASVSHDLRTPLTTIKALAHDLAAEGEERAMTIEEEADRLNRLVANLLDLSRLSSGSHGVSPEPNEAEDLIGAALQRVSGTAAGREIRVSLDEREPLLFGRFDFTQTLRVLVNLLENALKYSAPPSPVELSARRDGGWLTFAVADRGQGVPAEERERIFEPFYRPAGSAPDVSGAGLGLAIARAITLAQHGALEVTEREGGGSVFTMRVPAVDVAELSEG